MKLNERRRRLLEFVKVQHGDQKRKYSGEPYWNHVLSVANSVAKYVPEAWEIGLCHDLFEDTACDMSILLSKLHEFGYNGREALNIAVCVQELTDQFTKENYPEWNRTKRKHEEAVRLGRISPLSQSVKYADMIDNSKSIIEHDRAFAIVYIPEKRKIINYMRGGNRELLAQCEEILSNSCL